jgi:hypothetical protein
MAIRISTGARNAMLGNGTNLGLRAALAAGFLYLYTGSQPATADKGATGTLLGKVTVLDDGTTGLTFDAPAAGVLAKAAPKRGSFTASRMARWAGSASAMRPTRRPRQHHVSKRVDGLVGTAGADANMSNTAVLTGAVSTVDSFALTLPARKRRARGARGARENPALP